MLYNGTRKKLSNNSEQYTKGRCGWMENTANEFIKDLRNSFFELTYQIPHTSYEQIIRLLTERLDTVLCVNYSAIHINNNWDVNKLISHDPNAEKFIKRTFPSLEKNKAERNTPPVLDETDVYTTTSQETQAYVIKIDSDKDRYFLFFIKQPTDGLDKKILLTVREELKQFLGIVEFYYQKELAERRSTYLFELTSRFHSTVPVATILNVIGKEIQKLYPAFSYCFLLSQEYEQCETVPTKMMEYSDETSSSYSTHAFITGEFKQRTDKAKEKTYLYAPLNGCQGVYGVIQMTVPYLANLPEEEVEFLTRFANIAGNAIERVTLYQSSTQLVSDLQLINDTAHKLNSNLELNEIVDVIKNQIVKDCKATQIGFFYNKNDKNNTYPFEILTGSTSYFWTTEGQDFATLIFERINKGTKSIFIGDFTQEIKRTAYRSVMAIPMRISENIYGVITILHEAPYFFSFEKFKLMESLVQHATLAISNSVLKDKLEKAVITDYLTNLYSRNYLDDKLNRHMTRDHQGTLVLFDIDNFKQINDVFGHYTGDKVLKQIAAVIKKCTRKGDTAARWGGEEFAIYIPEATVEDGVNLAERIRKKVERTSDPPVTLSCGISTWKKERKDSVRDLFVRADKSLYEAKGTGKNRVVSDEGTMRESS
ncbi:diguanylate cyclase domain-containing protein [Virgibacillus sp. W0430]|uniref:sensor domain-containing diguanylate cyclase n=1 Tax=Virgibacillus sp. W0430 TaxID=3391580 RepID=UPI003F45EBEE